MRSKGLLGVGACAAALLGATPASAHVVHVIEPGETPWAAATWPTAVGVTHSAVGWGGADGTARGLGGAAGGLGAGAPVGSFRGVPTSSSREGSSPFIHASVETPTPLRAAMAVSVSPGRTT